MQPDPNPPTAVTPRERITLALIAAGTVLMWHLLAALTGQPAPAPPAPPPVTLVVAATPGAAVYPVSVPPTK